MKLITILLFFVSLQLVLSVQHGTKDVVSKNDGLATTLLRRRNEAERSMSQRNIITARNAARRRRKKRRRKGKKTKEICRRLRRNCCNRCQKRLQRQDERGMCDQIERCEVRLMACVKKRQFQVQTACGGPIIPVSDCDLLPAAKNTSP
mmetsp:Transcript_614/g.1290  ORF Transcript_614/g.1290 Transcript_614/m.1290 type:complete len:149 (+) Transcript_614:46-492(+)